MRRERSDAMAIAAASGVRGRLCSPVRVDVGRGTDSVESVACRGALPWTTAWEGRAHFLREPPTGGAGTRGSARVCSLWDGEDACKRQSPPSSKSPVARLID